MPYMEYDRQIGQHIKSLRTAAQMTQEQLSAKLQVAGCDISRATLAKIEVGIRRLYPYELKSLREVLCVSYEDILGS